jgi:NADH-quinone oxidoreductase subunit E
MLSEEIKDEIGREASHYEQKRAACIEALKIVQRSHRWVSDEHLGDVAALLDMTPDELDNVATFYTMIFRKPVGEHVILLCDSVSCWIMGSASLQQHLSQRLGIEPGQTTSDGKFTLLPMPCLGTCDHAPAMMIDDTTYRDLDPAKIDQILESFR